MAFGIKREELLRWKRLVKNGEIAFLTHYWLDPKFPNYKTVTKVGCCDLDKLVRWGDTYQLKKDWIHDNPYPHFDLLGKRQYEILLIEGQTEQIDRFQLQRH